MREPRALRALAERVGILAGYAAAGGRWKETSDVTREALLAAIGIDASSEPMAERSMAELDAHERAALIEPVQLIEPGERLRIPLRIDRDSARGAGATLSIEHEDGAREELCVPIAPTSRGAVVSLPTPLVLGEHAVHLQAELATGSREATQICLVAPRRALDLSERLAQPRAFGLWANLYSLRSEQSLASGIGDFGTLAALVAFASEAGAAFVGLSPLHAVRNGSRAVSPYSPISRLFRNPIYLDVTAVPEWAESDEARAAAELEELGRLDAAPRIDHARVWACKRAVLEHLYRCFRERHGGAESERGRAYRAFCHRRGSRLEDFATFLALDDEFAARGHTHDWRAWPEQLQDPRSPATAAFRESHAAAVDFHLWCQFELDRQMACAAQNAHDCGLSIGLYSDLAVGTVGSGFDPWAFPGLFVDGVHLGAPPDDYADAGQDWGFSPTSPERLRHSGYRYWRMLLQAAFEHSGALRIDHALGLYRQYWIPAGRPASEGAYVRFPADDLLRLIALESHRQGALVVGEDLGTIPDGFASLLARHGLLSTRVLLFERDRDGRFRAASRYSKRALVTAHTHDHPPLAGYWRARDLELRREAGAIRTDADLEAARDRRRDACAALERRLAVVPPTTDRTSEVDALCASAYRFLASTPSPLVGVSVDDLAGERDPVNLPGVAPEHHPSWTRRMREPVERLHERAEAQAILDALSSRASTR